MLSVSGVLNWSTGAKTVSPRDVPHPETSPENRPGPSKSETLRRKLNFDRVPVHTTEDEH